MARRQSLKQSSTWQAATCQPYIGSGHHNDAHLDDYDRPSPRRPLPTFAADILIPSWSLDGLGRLQAANPALLNFLGMDSRHSRQLNGRQLLHPADRAHVRRAFKQTAECGSEIQPLARLRHRSGQFRWVQLFAQWQPAHSGRPPHWSGSLVDIHEQIMDQQRLRDELDIRTKMLDASVDCVKYIGLDGNIINMNRAGCLALGVPVDSIDFGMSWLSLLPAEIHPAVRRALRQTRRGQTARFPGKSLAADGSTQYWDNMLTPVCDRQGQVSSILCISREVTRQRAAEQQLRIACEIDPLTGLRNRRAFEAQVRKLLRQAAQ